MHETCKSCGTVFEVNESILTSNIQWLKCGVCNKKWPLSSKQKENLIKNDVEIKYKTEKVKKELASIKSVVEDKSKILAKKPNPVLDQKNKTVAEIASELSLSKLNETNKNKIKKNENGSEKKKIKKLNIYPFFIITLGLIIFLAIFFRSTLLSYSIFYFPTLPTAPLPCRMPSHSLRGATCTAPRPRFPCGISPIVGTRNLSLCSGWTGSP